MSKGKYKRKREHEQRKAEQESTKIRLHDSEGVHSQNQATAETAESEGQDKQESSVISGKRLKQYGITDWLLAVFTLALVVTSIYQMVILGGQLDQMKLDQRPWLKVTVKSLQTVVRGSVTAPYAVENIGKTPALKVDGWLVIRPLPMTDPIDFDNPTVRDATRGMTSRPFDRFTAGIVFPSEDMKTAPAIWLHTTLNPSGSPPSTIGADTWTPELQELYEDGQIFVDVHGEFVYYDYAGTKHWTRVCAHFQPDGISVPYETSRSCDAYRSVDSNK